MLTDEEEKGYPTDDSIKEQIKCRTKLLRLVTEEKD